MFFLRLRHLNIGWFFSMHGLCFGKIYIMASFISFHPYLANRMNWPLRRTNHRSSLSPKLWRFPPRPEISLPIKKQSPVDGGGGGGGGSQFWKKAAARVIKFGKRHGAGKKGEERRRRQMWHKMSLAGAAAWIWPIQLPQHATGGRGEGGTFYSSTQRIWEREAKKSYHKCFTRKYAPYWKAHEQKKPHP